MITDELREHAKGEAPHYEMAALLEIADHIDAEHERQCAESWMRGHDAWAAIDRSDEMAEHGWVRLPVDADGEVIHVGDVMEFEHRGKMLVAPVDTIELSRDHEGYLWSIMVDHQCVRYSMGGLEMRHYKPPTVEDVLREFAQDCLTYATNVDDHEVVDAIEKYAERLQLKESE